ncbi:hypothetical protein NO263_01355 [Gluconacetobacter entanii]|uniref:Uncharacterized protein n=1 Tax=Gluconacetobacter entanii TaxID=108528 RepID=A0ABT3K1G9_9PROT|nr:hypothetical protein [Gluconacetobacter entanii]MCW4589238.1 hypothetical protein [Gluconacetobacter entanii]MCW4592827.1 hypothetical protein [Gluconacetobacter entanii]
MHATSIPSPFAGYYAMSRIPTAIALLSCLPLLTGAPQAWAQKHPNDSSVDRPGDNSPSALERTQPYDRRTEPLPSHPTHPLPRLPATPRTPTPPQSPPVQEAP